MTSVIDEKGRVTIPKKIRDALGLQPGEEIDFILINDNLLLKKKISPDEFIKISNRLSEKFDKETSKPIDVEKLL